MTLPERMSKIMTERKISKADLAKKLNISYSTIQSWIKRNSDPGSIYVEPIAKALNVSINYLITGKEELPEQIPEDKQLLLNYYDQCNQEGKNRILEQAEFIASKYPQRGKSSEYKIE
ncbi:MAG: helix-turn-helix domain-containing protein [Lachnospiraceae bacterium]|nr:helix-turn-helix domain-containing protein [Lachnospiraceae bacterium]